MQTAHSQLACPVCVDDNPAILFPMQERSLLICPVCRHVFWSHMPSEADLRTYYRGTYTETHDQVVLQNMNLDYYRGHLGELANYMGSEPKDIRLVDYCCSIPHLLIEARRKQFLDSIGVDWDHHARRIGAAHGVTVLSPTEFLTTVPDRSVDIVRFSHVLEHAIDPISVLRAARNKVRDGGLVYITQPSIPVLECRESSLEPHDAVWPEHLHFFSPLSLDEMGSRAGFRIERFFTHQAADVVAEKYAGYLDLGRIRSGLRALAKLGDPLFGSCANYPIYAGENSVLFARR